jgi:hypothetical protein
MGGEGAHREIAVRSIVCLYMARILSPEENRNIVESFARRMRTLGPENIIELGPRGPVREMNAPFDGWTAYATLRPMQSGQQLSLSPLSFWILTRCIEVDHTVLAPTINNLEASPLETFRAHHLCLLI